MGPLWQWLAALLISETPHITQTRAEVTLVALFYNPLPVGSIKPLGWLRGEMTTVASGLAGHGHDFYSFVRNSRWLSPTGDGDDYSNLNEALPYWFNGLVPLAYSLDDDDLKEQEHAVADTVLNLQSSDGWIGPEKPAERNFWARTPLFLGLTQLAEANGTWEGRVVDGLRKFLVLANAMLKDDSFGFARCAEGVDCRWGQVRIADMILTIQWLLDNHADDIPDNEVGILWDNMRMFNDQNQYNWADWYQDGTYPKVVNDPTPGNPKFPYMHGVNVGQGFKASAVIHRFTNDASLVDASMRAVNWTFTYHGSPSGTILADEIIRDLSPHSGSELCTAVETAYSLSYLYQALGDSYYADRAELAIFNALPAMLMPDAWAHQYMAQPNQPWATDNSSGIFTTANSGVATSFGLEPEYPCCTVNFPQGYPKFLTHSWARTPSGLGLVHMLLAPSEVKTTVSGQSVTISVDTDYPFANTLTYLVDAGTPFDLDLRVPSWSQQTTITVNEVSQPPHPTSPSNTQLIPLPAGKSTVRLTLSYTIRTVPRASGSISVYVGNLLYALDVGQLTTTTLPHAFTDPHGPGMTHIPFPQVRDHYLEPTEPWNVAIDPSTLSYHGLAGDMKSAGLSTGVFDYDRTPTYITVRGCQVQWGLFDDRTPEDRPLSGKCVEGTTGTFRLIPYGAAKVHMAELPTVDLKAARNAGEGLVVNG
ncbi:hypothetical protein GE09DRAFT_472492 [Coniochaeta sp. 2T2.1]|nr:hypothetical protein GE09DRAFT_472492 [Coniochaeta sp. 2T2.1]